MTLRTKLNPNNKIHQKKGGKKLKGSFKTIDGNKCVQMM